MIDQTQEGGTAQQIPFPGVAPKYLPAGNNLLLDYQKPTMAGSIILPHQAKELDTIVATVLAKGPKCEHIQVGQRVCILTKALIGGVNGLMVEGRRIYLTQEQTVITVVESNLAKPTV